MIRKMLSGICITCLLLVMNTMMFSTDLSVDLVNVAPGSSIIASSTFAAAFGPENAIDDDPATVWGSGIGVKQEYLVIDLKQREMIDHIGLDWYENYYATTYAIGISDDGINWELINDTIPCAGGYERISCRRLSRFVGILFHGKNNVAIGLKDVAVVAERVYDYREWTYTYGGSKTDDMRFVERLKDGSILGIGFTDSGDIPGISYPATGNHVYVTKLDPLGNKIWDTGFTMDTVFLNYAFGPDERLFINNTGNGDDYHIKLWCIDKQGTVVSLPSYLENIKMKGIEKIERDNSYIMMGSRVDTGKLVITKLDAANALVWQKEFDMTDEYRYCMTERGDLYIWINKSGTVYGYVLDDNAELKGTWRYNGGGYTTIRYMQVLSDGTIIIAGNRYISKDFVKAYIARLDKNYKLLWEGGMDGDRFPLVHSLKVGKNVIAAVTKVDIYKGPVVEYDEVYSALVYNVDGEKLGDEIYEYAYPSIEILFDDTIVLAHDDWSLTNVQLCTPSLTVIRDKPLMTGGEYIVFEKDGSLIYCGMVNYDFMIRKTHITN